MTALRRIYLVTRPGRSAVVVAPGPDEAVDMAWFGAHPAVRVYLLGVARDGVPAGRVGYLDLVPADLIAVLQLAAAAGPGPGGDA